MPTCTCLLGGGRDRAGGQDGRGKQQGLGGWGWMASAEAVARCHQSMSLQPTSSRRWGIAPAHAVSDPLVLLEYLARGLLE